jgi:hypothetical protein
MWNNTRIKEVVYGLYVEERKAERYELMENGEPKVSRY